MIIDFLNYADQRRAAGLLYALIAMGFVVIYRASKVFNFAQGELVVFGGFLVWWTVISWVCRCRSACRWPSSRPPSSAC